MPMGSPQTNPIGRVMLGYPATAAGGEVRLKLEEKHLELGLLQVVRVRNVRRVDHLGTQAADGGDGVLEESVDPVVEAGHVPSDADAGPPQGARIQLEGDVAFGDGGE